ncbi:SANTA domain-containing protein [Forsythia ovata]|uniref:SANTA domain-containing protein n=1 Tax=Forsythia ovata TaxID=205694 RepID=A0ABD1UCZ8_9LAMI
MVATPTSVLLRRNYSRKTPSSSTSTAVCSFFLKEIFLHDWWLLKVDKDPHEKRLGIGGFTSRESQGTRVFHSAPISIRLNAVTLKTEDGITITVHGHLNRTRTIENGFPLEVCNHFVFGFPYYWEEFAGLSFDEEPTSFDFSKEISGSNGNKTSSPDSSKSSLPVALDYLPVTVIRDLFMIAPGECGGSILRKNILDDILQTYGGNATDEAPLNCKNMKAEQKRRSNSDVIDAEPRTKKNKRNTVVDCGLRGIGPLTRSRTRMKQ